MIWSYLDLFGTGDLRVRGIVPIDAKLPHEDRVVFHDLFQLRAAGRYHDVWRARRRQTLAVDVGVVQEVCAVDDDTLFGGRLSFQHLRAIGDARMLLDHFVAGAGRNIVAVGPDRRSGIIRKERPQEFVAIVRAKRIWPDADCIAHRVRALRSRRGRLAPRLRRLVELNSRTEKPDGRAGLIFFSGHAHLGRIAVVACLRLVGANSSAPERRHHDEPAIGKLVITNDGVTIVSRLARATEALENRVSRDWPVQNFAGLSVLLPLPCEDRHPRIDDLKDVVRSNRETVVRRIAHCRSAVWAFEPHAKAVETFHERRTWPSTLRCLFNVCRAGRTAHNGRPDGGWTLPRGFAARRMVRIRM